MFSLLSCRNRVTPVSLHHDGEMVRVMEHNVESKRHGRLLKS